MIVFKSASSAIVASAKTIEEAANAASTVARTAGHLASYLEDEVINMRAEQKLEHAKRLEALSQGEDPDATK